ncbi:MAG TPA: PAS domain-containing sensor histidine kinase [Chroococcales cyanobacterium]
MFSQLKLGQQATMILSLCMVLQIGMIMLLVLMDRQAALETRRAVHAQTIIEHLTKASNLWSKLAVAAGRVLTYPDLNESPASKLIKDLHAEYRELSDLLQNYPEDLADVQKLRLDSDAGLELLSKAKDAWFYQDKLRYHRYLREVAQVLDGCTERSNNLIDRFCENQRLAHESQIKQGERNRLGIFLCVSVNVCLMFILAWLFISNIAHRLEHIARNSVLLAIGKPLESRLSGNDEIAQLDGSFHTMASLLNEAAAKERALINNARDMICELDADGVLVQTNPAATLLLGHGPDDLRGRVLISLVIPEDRERVLQALTKIAHGDSQQDTSDTFECTMLTKLGESVVVSFSAYWSAQTKSLFCVLHDVTQHRQIERMKRQFIAMMTHDLRSPLTAIGNTLQLLSAGVYSAETETGQMRINEAEMNINRMLRLISDLLEREKFDVSQLTLEIEKVALETVVNESVGSVRAYAEQQKLNLESACGDITLDVDRTRLVQVVVNLLANAIKFSPAGSKVSVTGAVDGDEAVITVSDSGVGISPEEQQTIFEPYKQAKSAGGRTRLEGTGLGLTICKSIVEAHHGKIGVISEEQKGSSFWIRLPLVQAQIKVLQHK